MPLRIRKLEGSGPLLHLATEALYAYAADPVGDLSALLLLVPTRQAGRRLRESLALRAARDGRGLLAPRILTPAALLSHAQTDSGLADETDRIAAWIQVLTEASPAEMRRAFPLIPDERTGWTYGTARQLARLRATLAEEGLGIGAVADAVRGLPFEPDRWSDLSRLESRYLSVLNEKGLKDPDREKIGFAAAPEIDAAIEQVIVVAVADPLPLALQALERIAQSRPVSVWTYGNGPFDDWGRPQTEPWEDRVLPLSVDSIELRSVADFSACADRCVASCTQLPADALSLGMLHPDLAAATASALSRHGLESFNPAGHALDQSGPGQLVNLLVQLLRERSPAQVRQLILHPDAWTWLSRSAERPLDPTKALAELDAACINHLPAEFTDLRHFARAGTVLNGLLEPLEALIRDLAAVSNPARRVLQWLTRIFEHRTLDPRSPTDQDWLRKAGSVRDTLVRVAACVDRFDALGSEHAWSMLGEAMSSTRIETPAGATAYELSGWLELLWSDAPHLLVAGFNEGAVPEPLETDLYLTEALREQLNMRSNRKRHARDAYLLDSMVGWRIEAGGSVTLLASMRDGDGSPLKPSRLLFQCGDKDLLERVGTLFNDRGPTALPLEPQPPQRMRPPQVPRPRTLPISGLSDYLRCPFRFCLSRILGMRSFEPDPREMDAQRFGTLFHDTVQQLAGLTIGPDSQAGALMAQLEPGLTRRMQRQFGTRPSLALRFQTESLRSRLQAFAHMQIEWVREHGSTEIIDTERAVEIAMGPVTLRGRIDRIDRVNGRRTLLIDYKTGDNAKQPAAAHLKRVGAKGRPDYLPDEAFVTLGGKDYQWLDLQLPLYVAAMREHGMSTCEVAYWNAAKTWEASGIETWPDLDESLVDAALKCAEALVRAILDGRFWPPNTDLHENYDAFAHLFPNGIAASADPAAFEAFAYAEREDAP